ncbi:MAG: type II toxin-antitoxin system VapC family toxin [Candidatus Saccharibacteria bacterium]|nr:type II toxin-antitoxin system VapC family toxin [Candidatus Saccharibacteria bacterium]
MILLDTHILIWYILASNKLKSNISEIIDQALRKNQLYVSSITFWEMELLSKKGKINFKKSISWWRQELLKQGLLEISVDGLIGIKSVALKYGNNDPADRIIIVTALITHSKLITADKQILDSPEKIDTLDAGT